MVRPGQIYKISANILQARLQMTIRASISCNGVEIADVSQEVKEGVPEILNMRVSLFLYCRSIYTYMKAFFLILRNKKKGEIQYFLLIFFISYYLSL